MATTVRSVSDSHPVADDHDDSLRDVLANPRLAVAVVQGPDGRRLALPCGSAAQAAALHHDRLLGVLPPLYPEWLGDRGFQAAHGCRFAYVAGEMARGIATPRMVIAAVRHGFMGFLGSAGLRPATIDAMVAEIEGALGPQSTAWGANLIHSPDLPEREREVVDLFLKRGVGRVSASAFMKLSPDVVRYAAAGLARGADGGIVRRTHVFAKISRPEVALPFLSPAPVEMLRTLVASGAITAEQADLARRVAVAEDITVESDSGGHTDNRPLGALLPAILHLRDAVCAQHGYARPVRVGAAGGLGTPAAVAAAFAYGAAYVLTGSINQAALESGLSPEGRAMLAEADVADVILAPASDMFELGVKVQVLRRGTLFAVRGQKLYELYKRHASLDEIEPKDRAWLETQVFKAPLDQEWAATRAYHAETNPALLAQAEREPKVKMALLFRRYLFMGAHWAREGVADRRADYQIWCGPAMGSFNRWAQGSFLERPEARTTGQIGLNLMEGAARIARAHQVRAAGVAVPASAFTVRPQPMAIAP